MWKKEKNTDKPEYNDHPRDPKIMVVVDRWSLWWWLCFKSSNCDQLINELLENPKQVQLVNRKFRCWFRQLFCRNFGIGFGSVLRKSKFRFISVTAKFQFRSFTNHQALIKYFLSYSSSNTSATLFLVGGINKFCCEFFFISIFDKVKTTIKVQ
jgi:hypothetical protein